MAANNTLNLIQFLSEVGKLKETPRRGWVLRGITPVESVAGHMYRMAITALCSLQNVSEVDINKVMKLCLVHDIAECIVGDITPDDGICEEEKHRKERETVQYLGNLLPNESKQQLLSLYEEYEKKETKEARLTKDLDRFDMVLQAFEYEKKEVASKGKLPNLQEFFDYDSVIKKIENEEVKRMVSEVLQQREQLLQQFVNGE
ncbi:HD domain-containing protein 2-like protein [Leptotrombidium deliense]|uniref:5'-deoxynucleotidase HDDC2 n=1 Tax=Leptotrombidium deliense TaxID=299467 RepID=A0A443SUP3_9ACAR|nr:HD domain-containing protein 2-like protein [Leptotrombidium deliense]